MRITKDVFLQVSGVRIQLEIVKKLVCEHFDKYVREHIFPHGVEGCWPSAMMVNVRPCARVTRRAIEI